MSYPSGWYLVNITGTYIARDGTPCTGSVTLSSPQLVLRAGTVVPAADIVFDLVNGTFSGQIPATDDPNASPVGWTYTVTENVPGGRQGYQIVAPHTSPGIDLSTVIPVTMPQPPTNGFPYVTLAQLANPAVGNGANLIGFIQDGTGAIASTVQKELKVTLRPEQFGAVGDGVTDDLASLDAMTTQLLSTPTGGKITLTPGKTYAVSAVWTITKTVGKQVFIEGNGSILTKTASYSGAIAYYGEPTGTVAGYPLICEGVRFIGIGTNCTGIILEWAGDSVMRDCTFDGGAQGVYCENSYGLKFDSSQFLNMTTAGIYASTTAHNMTVAKCVFSNNACDVQFGAAAYNLGIYDCDMEGGAACVYLSVGGACISMHGNYIENKTSSQIQFGSLVTSFDFSNNWLSYNTGTQAWSNIGSGSMKRNIFWNQQQTQDATVNNFDIGDNTFSGTSNVIYRQWTAPSFLNSFSNVGGAWANAGYTLSDNGEVSLRGMITATADNDAFLLPAGMRPSQDTTFPVLGADAGSAHVIVRSTGYVSVYRASDATADLGAIKFYAGG